LTNSRLISENLTTCGLFLKALKRRRNVDEKQAPAKKLLRFRERWIAANIAKLPNLLPKSDEYWGRDMGEPYTGRAIINESKYPYIVAIAVVGKGLDIGLSRRIMDFHATRHVQPRHGRSTIPKGEGKAYYRWRFSDLETAQSFVEQFGGTIVQT